MSLIPNKRIENKIILIRGHKVILDKDLADLYKVPSKRLNEQVKRNRKRFPEDFMFQLTKDEVQSLRSQFATLKKGRGKHYKYMPYVFTEPGVAMLSSVLKSNRAIQVNIQIIRTFIKLRQLLLTHTELRKKIESMEKKYDQRFKVVFEAIRQLLKPPDKPKRIIGFRTNNQGKHEDKEVSR